MVSEMPPEYTALDESTNLLDTEKTIPRFENDLETFGTSFATKNCRIAFIQKVLSIKLLQLLTVTTIIVIFYLNCYPDYRLIDSNHNIRNTRIHLILWSTLLLAATMGTLHYCNKARLVVPFNYMLLAAYPVSFGVFISSVSYDWLLTRVMVSWIYFTIVIFALLLYSILALETKIEFKTSIGLYITTGVLIVSFVLTVPLMHHISSAFIVFYFSLAGFIITAYMLNNIQAMVSNDYRIHLAPGDFVKAAVLMHVDYRYIFMRMYNKHARSNPA